MINILLSTFDKSLYNKLNKYIKPNMRICVIPFSYDLDWLGNVEQFQNHFGYDNGKHRLDIVDKFRDYGIQKEDVYVANRFTDSIELMKSMINKSDIIFLTGGDPCIFMDLLRKYDLVDTIQQFNGIVIGKSAGAMIQLDEYYLYPCEHERIEYYMFFKGLGLVKDLQMIVHWEGTKEQREALSRLHLCYMLDGNYNHIKLLRDGEYEIIEHEPVIMTYEIDDEGNCINDSKGGLRSKFIQFFKGKWICK